ncbi:PAS domain S-box-containing protein [Pseudomonas psychrotolerans]|nr:PAS domain S-box-containing protein [Pseudomonas psychrotolerans]
MDKQRLVLAQARQTLLLELSRCAVRKPPSDSELAKLLLSHGPAAFTVDQVSLWRLDDNGLTCLTSDERITTPCSDHQRRLREQGLIEDASQVLQPPNTAAGTALDVALIHDDTLTGLLCLRRAQAATWEAGDVGFARDLADCLAALVHGQERPPERGHPLTRVMEASTDAFLLLDADGRLEHATDSFTRITGYPNTRIQGTLIEALPALENWSELLYEAWQRLAHQDSWQGELRCYRRDGESYWGMLSLSKILQPNGELQGYLGIFQNTSKIRFAQQQNDEVVFRDSLTGLANRNHFIARLEARLEQSNANREHSLLLVDIDNFKRVNDSLWTPHRRPVAGWPGPPPAHGAGQERADRPYRQQRIRRPARRDGRGRRGRSGARHPGRPRSASVCRGSPHPDQLLDRPDHRAAARDGSADPDQARRSRPAPGQGQWRPSGPGVHRGTDRRGQPQAVHAEQFAPCAGAERAADALPAQGLPQARQAARPGSPDPLAASGKRA